jgi:WD40 repeat protein
VAVTAARLSPDGGLVASGDKDGNVIIWANHPGTAEKYSGKQLAGAVRDIAWTADNERIIVVGEGKGEFGSIISISGNTIGVINGHSQTIATCELRKTRPFRALTGGADTKLCFFEGPPFKFVHSLATFKGTVNCIRVSDDDEKVACVSGSNEVVLLDAKSGQRIGAVQTDHQGSIYSVAWAPGGNTIITAGADKTVKTFSISGGPPLTTTTFGKSVQNMQQGVFSLPDGFAAVSLSGAVNFIASDGSVARTWLGHQRTPSAVYFDEPTSSIVSVGQDGTVLRWDAGAPGRASQIVIEADIVLASCHKGTTYAVATGNSLVCFDVASADVRVVSNDLTGSVGVSILGNQCIVHLQRSCVSLIDASGKKIAEERLPQFNAAVVAAHDNTFAIGGDNAVRVMSGQSKKIDQVLIMDGHHKSGVTALAFSPNGQVIASGDSSRLIYLWNSATGEVTRTLSYHTLRVTSLTFDSAGSLLLSGSVDCAVVLYDTNSNRKRMQDCAHRGGVSAVTFGRNGELFSAGADNAIRRWGT